MLPTTFATHGAAFLFDVALKSFVLFAVAATVSFALRRASAASRHALWLLTLVSLLCLPVFCAFLPHWSAPILPATTPHTIVLSTKDIPLSKPMASATSVPLETKPSAAVQQPIEKATEAISAAPSSAVISPMGWVFLVWLAGMMIVQGRTLHALIAARSLLRHCHRVEAGPVWEESASVKETLGLTRSLDILAGNSDGLIVVPMTMGLFRAIVLLPHGTSDWPSDRLQAVLLHETAHVKRFDWATMLLARTVCALYWYHPLVWLAAARMRTESEGACDDLVLTSGVSAPNYAAHLLEIVQGLPTRSASLSATVAMAQRHEIADRLKTILAENKNRSGLTGKRLAVAALTTLIGVAVTAGVRPVASRPLHEREKRSEAAQSHITDAGGIEEMMAGHSDWEVTLSDKTRVRLLSIAAMDTHYKITSVWTPNGVSDDPRVTSLPPSRVPEMHLLQFLIGVEFPSDGMMQDSICSFGKAGEHTGSTYHLGPEYNRNNRVTVVRFGEYYADTQTHAALQLSLATGPKTTLISAPLKTGAIRRLPTGETITVSPADTHSPATAHVNGKLVETTSLHLTLPARFAHDISGYEFQIIGSDGKQFYPQHSGFSGPQVSGQTARFLLTYRTAELLDRAKELRVTYRPSRTAVFHNIALKPLVLHGILPTSPEMQKEANNQLTDIANLRLIGLGITRYVMSHGYRYPSAEHWMDEIIPYVIPEELTGAARQQRIAALFHDPAAPPGQIWSYAYNRALSKLSASQIDAPASTVAVFESRQNVRNASDDGRSIATPGWHVGGSGYLFTDGHVKRFRQLPSSVSFNPLSPTVANMIPVGGYLYHKETHQFVHGTYVIFSRSPDTVTTGSVWPSSYTKETGHFQSVLYPGKNYLLVLKNGRFRPLGKMIKYEANGNTGKITTIGVKPQNSLWPLGNYVVQFSLPSKYTLEANSNLPQPDGGENVAFVPFVRTTKQPVLFKP